MVFTGNYGDVSGPGIKSLLAVTNPGLADQLGMEIDRSVVLAEVIPSPFDLHLRDSIANNDPGREAVLQTIHIAGNNRPIPSYLPPKQRE